MKHSQIGLFTGPALFLLLLGLSFFEPSDPAPLRVAAVMVLMAVWWITEAIPIAATSLLPIVLFPILGVMDGSKVTLAYGNHLVFLFMGGFFIAVTVEKWNLHKRLALHTINIIGVTPARIILGFMVATAFLSMWISNLAATMMMVTIAMAVLKQTISQLESQQQGIKIRIDEFNFGTALVLGIAYSASIGGISTLVGTAPNAIFAGLIEQSYQITISMVEWSLVTLPLSVIMLFITWVYLVRVAFPLQLNEIPGGRKLIREQLNELGRINRNEIKICLVLILVATLWIINGIMKIELLNYIQDSTIAIFGALLLFVIPADLKQKEFLLDWKTAVDIPWDILILFGGGFALASGFSESGLTQLIAGKLSMLQEYPLIIILATVTTLVIFLTEVTSNTATATIILPILLVLAEVMQIHPAGLMMSAVIAASFAFMLPVATPPNAIVFGTRYVTMKQMVRAGFWLNIIGIFLITLFVYFIMPVIWQIDIHMFPSNTH